MALKPNCIRFGLGTGHIGAESNAITVGGDQDRDGNSCILVTDENRVDVVEALRAVAYFLEAELKQL